MSAEKGQHMANVYQYLCLHENVEEAVSALQDHALRDLAEWLDADGTTTGIPGMVSGLLLCEAAKRFLEGDSL